MMRKIITIFIMLWLLLNNAFADVIKNYDVQITVLENGTIDVVETIEMDIDHQDVRLGIIRDIPTSYNVYQSTVETPINVLSVKRNGEAENYWVYTLDDQIKIYTGKRENLEENYLPKGRNVYELHWQSENHIRGFWDYDELYFNAIGDDWNYLIEDVSVTVTLPDQTNVIQTAGYYGPRGSNTKANVSEISDQQITYTVDKILGKGWGLTVAAGFDKGIVQSTSVDFRIQLIEKILSYLPHSVQPVNVILLIMLIVSWIYWFVHYCIFRWKRPKSQRAFTVRFSPPNMPMDKMMALHSKDYRRFSARFKLALLVDLAQKGILTFRNNIKAIELDPTKLDAQDDLTEGQKNFVRRLTMQNTNMAYYNTYNETLERALNMLSAPVFNYGKSFYISLFPKYNSRLCWILIALMILSTVVIHWSFYILLFFMFVGITIVFDGLYKLKKLFSALFAISFGLLFCAIPVFITFRPIIQRDHDFLPAIIIYLTIIAFFIMMGLQDRIRLRIDEKYLDAQQEVLEFIHFLKYVKEYEYRIITPDVFEEYLPYAIMFGVEKNWIKFYQKWHPVAHQNSLKNGAVAISNITRSSAFSDGITAPSSSQGHGSHGGGSGGGRGSGSGGGGSSGGGSGGGGGGGR